MMVSTIIMTACFILIAFEVLSFLLVMKSCRNVSCRVLTSKKVSVRQDGFLIKDYFKTEAEFELDGVRRSATLETSTLCQQGQVLNCYYYPKKNIVFRKRDIRNIMRSRSLPAFSVGVLFLVLTLLFRMTSLGGIIIAHVFETVAVILTVVFAAFGVGFIVYSVNAFRHTRESRVTTVKAEVIDVVRTSKRHKEVERFTYYPIYRYELGGFDHTVQSKLGREEPPKKGCKESVLADTKKGGLIEYKDIDTSFFLGICFVIIAGLLVYATVFIP